VQSDIITVTVFVRLVEAGIFVLIIARLRSSARRLHATFKAAAFLRLPGAMAGDVSQHHVAGSVTGSMQPAAAAAST
jgi:hypothetical protein